MCARRFVLGFPSNYPNFEVSGGHTVAGSHGADLDELWVYPGTEVISLAANQGTGWLCGWACWLPAEFIVCIEWRQAFSTRTPRCLSGSDALIDNPRAGAVPANPRLRTEPRSSAAQAGEFPSIVGMTRCPTHLRTHFRSRNVAAFRHAGVHASAIGAEHGTE